MSDGETTQLGEPFECVERSAIDTLNSLGAYLIAANDPPWSSIADRVPAPVTVVSAHDMEVAKLDRDVEHTADDGAEVVVGFGGGTALDTAKYLAWKRGLPLVQIPTLVLPDGTVMTESVAILLWLMDRHPGDEVECPNDVVDVHKVQPVVRR